MNAKNLITKTKCIIVKATKLLLGLLLLFFTASSILTYDIILAESALFIKYQDDNTIAKSTTGRLYLTEMEAERFDTRTTSIMNDVIMFKNANKLNNTTISMAVESGIISTNKFWRESNEYYIYTARPFSVWRKFEDTPVLKLDILCTLPMPSDLICSAYDDAPKFIQQATAGKYSTLLYFKKNIN